MNFLKVSEHIEAGDEVNVGLTNDDKAFGGKVIEITEDEIIIEFERFSTTDPKLAVVNKYITILNKEDVQFIQKVENAKTYI